VQLPDQQLQPSSLCIVAARALSTTGAKAVAALLPQPLGGVQTLLALSEYLCSGGPDLGQHNWDF
jgi:hypothetical protein